MFPVLYEYCQVPVYFNLLPDKREPTLFPAVRRPPPRSAACIFLEELSLHHPTVPAACDSPFPTILFDCELSLYINTSINIPEHGSTRWKLPSSRSFLD